jgi:multiple antibiotic resistance protein
MTVRSGIQIFISLFVLVNPLEGIPFFLGMTGGAAEGERARIARRAATAVTIILLVSALTGAKVLTLFGVGLPAFQVGGGIILFLIALQMTLVGLSSEKSGAVASDHPGPAHDIAIVPLAIPLLGGPGAISGAILYGTRTGSLEDLGLLCALTLLVGLATYLSLRAAEPLRRLLKDTGINIATRLMGLLIAAIAVQLTIEGLLEMLPR